MKLPGKDKRTGEPSTMEAKPGPKEAGRAGTGSEGGANGSRVDTAIMGDVSNGDADHCLLMDLVFFWCTMVTEFLVVVVVRPAL